MCIRDSYNPLAAPSICDAAGARNGILRARISSEPLLFMGPSEFMRTIDIPEDFWRGPERRPQSWDIRTAHESAGNLSTESFAEAWIL
eukprot:2275075-Alexandrium_andersonii.AAC.1